MSRLVLKFESSALKEVPLGTRPVTIGRAPDNDIPIDNLAVSNYHARVYVEAGSLVVEDLNSLNGSFLNDIRVERAMLKDGDSILIGKHHILVDQAHDAALPLDGWRKAPAPRVNETMVLDTHERRKMLEQAAAAGERSQLSPDRIARSDAYRPARPHGSKRVPDRRETDRDRPLENGHGSAPRMVHAGHRGANQQARGRLLPGPWGPRAENQRSSKSTA